MLGVSSGHALPDFLNSRLAQELTQEHRRMFRNTRQNYYLDFAAVLQEHRRKGIARLLTEEREAYAKRNGFTHASFRTVTPARIELAKKMGYKELFRHEASGRTAESSVTKRIYFQRKLR